MIDRITAALSRRHVLLGLAASATGSTFCRRLFITTATLPKYWTRLPDTGSQSSRGQSPTPNHPTDNY
jgi:hypothetical protein